MLAYIVRRGLYSIPTLLLITLVSFWVITLPPGDYMTTLQARLESQGGLTFKEAHRIAEQMRERYGLDKPFIIQYGKWLLGLFRGDLGYSFNYRKPVFDVIWVRMGWTFLIALSCHLLSVIGGLLPGIYSATHQYSWSDHFFTVVAYLGLAIPNFFLALVILYILVFQLGASSSVGGLFSPEFVMAPWGWAKFIDLLKHLWIPVFVVGTAGTARNMRVMRGNLLDVLNQPYIQVARAKGLKERVVIYKHAVINALQPIVMYLGTTMPFLVQGAIVTNIVLALPTAGPMFYDAIMTQDMYLAGSFLLIIAIALLIGDLLADMVLALIDPRIRYD